VDYSVNQDAILFFSKHDQTGPDRMKVNGMAGEIRAAVTDGQLGRQFCEGSAKTDFAFQRNLGRSVLGKLVE
jgi:hypothetical protein